MVIANLVVWANVFKTLRRAVLSASMKAVLGRIQREGEVVHLVAQRITDLSANLASVGTRDVAFPVPHGCGDEVRNGGSGSDPRELPPKGLRTRDIYIPLCRVRHNGVNVSLALFARIRTAGRAMGQFIAAAGCDLALKFDPFRRRRMTRSG